MKILFYIFIFLILFNLFFTNDILASENFKADLKMEYVFDSSGTAHVVNEIKIENLTSQLYAKSIQFSLKDVNPINIKIHDKYSNLNYLKTINDQEINFDIKFKDTNVGKSNKFEFFIEFDEESLAKKKGDVWEIDIPKLDKENIFEINEIKLTVPNTFGNESFISPKPDKSITNDNNKTYIFLDNKLLIRGVNANFGQFQIYSFSITYHLENELNRKDNINIFIISQVFF